MSIKFGEVPRYLQLAAFIREQIESGEIPEHAPIPSKAALKLAYGVSGGTVDKAVNLLRTEGRLVTIPGIGLFVTERQHWKS